MTGPASPDADAVPHGWVDAAPRVAALAPADAAGPADRHMALVLALRVRAGARRRGDGPGFEPGARRFWLLALFAVGSVVMRGAGCTYNDIVDRDIDAPSRARADGRSRRAR
jgi:4-hydroxybenzoate polyprenyltransferase